MYLIHVIELYIAVGGNYGQLSEHSMIGETNASKNSIQILCVNPLEKKDALEVKFIILHDFGNIFDLKWCPAQPSSLV